MSPQTGLPTWPTPSASDTYVEWEDRDRGAFERAVREERLLRLPGGVRQRDELPAVDLLSAAGDFVLEEVRQGEIHVVAAEEDVVAHRDALQGQVALPLGHRDEAEVGRATAHVDHEDEVAGLYEGMDLSKDF